MLMLVVVLEFSLTVGARIRVAKSMPPNESVRPQSPAGTSL